MLDYIIDLGPEAEIWEVCIAGTVDEIMNNKNSYTEYIKKYLGL